IHAKRELWTPGEYIAAVKKVVRINKDEPEASGSAIMAEDVNSLLSRLGSNRTYWGTRKKLLAIKEVLCQRKDLWQDAELLFCYKPLAKYRNDLDKLQQDIQEATDRRNFSRKALGIMIRSIGENPNSSASEIAAKLKEYPEFPRRRRKTIIRTVEFIQGLEWSDWSRLYRLILRSNFEGNRKNTIDDIAEVEQENLKKRRTKKENSSYMQWSEPETEMVIKVGCEYSTQFLQNSSEYTVNWNQIPKEELKLFERRSIEALKKQYHTVARACRSLFGEDIVQLHERLGGDLKVKTKPEDFTNQAEALRLGYVGKSFIEVLTEETYRVRRERAIQASSD
ncbi:MAG: hypothetical protein LBJ13_02085, partial [Puniceicoccales bacterium]|nr:hypothetical protein [Puniceicoccales bacterium]